MGQDSPRYWGLVISQVGELNHAAKLTDADVIGILRMLDEGRLSQRQIARIYGVSQSTISHINRGVNWSHMTSPPPQDDLA